MVLHTTTRTYYGQESLILPGRSSDLRISLGLHLPADITWQWIKAVVVPAYSAGPTSRICTAFPFHPRIKYIRRHLVDIFELRGNTTEEKYKSKSQNFFCSID